MTDSDFKPIDPPAALGTAATEVQPSWKPLIWLVAILAAAIGLGELLFDVLLDVFELIFDIIETIYLYTIEAPEEVIEDHIENWLVPKVGHDAARYSEIITAVTFTPFKILAGILLVRGLWRWQKQTLFPKITAWAGKHALAVRLAWNGLFWPWKTLLVVGVLGGLLILI
jgi:hypothetical protein